MNAIHFKQKRAVQGTSKQHAWSDTTEYEIPFDCDEPESPELRERIERAFYRSKLTQAESSWGRLRWSCGYRLDRIDFDRRVIVATHSIGLCD